MAVGFTPKHTEDFPLNDLTQEQFLILANEAATKIEWEVGYISNNGLIAYTNYGMFSWNAEVKITIEDGIAQIRSASTGNELMDWGRNKKMVNLFISTLEELKTNFAQEEFDLKYQELKERLVVQEDDMLTLPPATTTEQVKDFFSIFRPKQGFFVTPILIDLNILIFILMTVSGVNIMLPDNDSLINWGANFKPVTLGGQWWRLLTCNFLHIGIFHLLMNMYALLYIGVLLEPHLGRARFLTAYLLTSITSSVVSLWWHDLTISAGASGAIFGMYGVFLAMLTTNLIEKAARKTLLTSIAVFVGYNLINGLKGGIDNAGHIGGLLGGLLIGYALIPSLKKPDMTKLKFGTIGILTVLILISSVVIYQKMPNDIGIYDEKIKTFASMESMALEVYNLPQHTSKDEILYALKEKGIYYWNENIKLIESFNELDLPLEIRTRNRLLKEYCELRLQSFELLYKMTSEETDQYNQQIENKNQEIDLKLKELGAE